MTTVTRPALLSSVAYIMQAAGITLAELAQHLGQQSAASAPPAAVDQGVDIDAAHRSRPSPNKGRPSPMKGRRMPLGGSAKLVLQLADCEEGATIPDLCAALGVNDSTVHHHIRRLTEDRLLTRVKLAGQVSPIYFPRPSHAAAWVEGQKQDAPAQPEAVPAPAPAPAPPAEPPRAVLSPAELKTLATNEKKRQAAHKGAPPLGKRTARQPDAGTIIPPKISDSLVRPQGEAIVTDATKINRDTTQRPTARWQAAELAPDPRYPSFASMRPGIDPRTGKAWGAAA